MNAIETALLKQLRQLSDESLLTRWLNPSDSTAVLAGQVLAERGYELFFASGDRVLPPKSTELSKV